MLAHQTGKGGAVFVPVMLAQPARLGAPDAKFAHHPIGHPHFDLIEQADAGRVKRVVKVKDPGGDMAKMLFHRPSLAPGAWGGNRRVVTAAPSR